MIRHIILNSILTIRKKFKKAEYGDIVIACDGRTYWRKEKFAYYKANRKKAREESKINWDLIFDVIAELRSDLNEYFPYKVVHIEKAEADDIIAILTKYSQTNELIKDGMMKSPQTVIAISEDQDFVQLYKYDNFKLYLPRKRKLYAKPSKTELREFVIEHIVKAGDDGIPNVLSSDDVFVTEPRIRQTTVSAKRLLEFKELGFDACKNEIEKRNWHRNQMLIDFEYIPNDVESNIIEAYQQAPNVMSRNSIMNYLIKNRCRQLLNNIEEF